MTMFVCESAQLAGWYKDRENYLGKWDEGCDFRLESTGQYFSKREAQALFADGVRLLHIYEKNELKATIKLEHYL